MALPNNPTPAELVKAVKELEQGGGGTSTDVQVDSTSITSGGVANIKSINGDYNASTNKFATESDLPLYDSSEYKAFAHINQFSTTEISYSLPTSIYKVDCSKLNDTTLTVGDKIIIFANVYTPSYVKHRVYLATITQDDTSRYIISSTIWGISGHTGYDETRKIALVDDVATKQDIISDLSTIRSGASAGATAVQPSNLLNLIFPIGSIYIGDENSSSPASWIGGTWQQIEDKFLLASGSSYTAGDTGGSATHTHTLDNGYAKIAYIWQDSQNRLIQNAKTVTQWSSTRYTRTSGNGYTDGAKNTTEAVTLGGSTDSSSNMPPYKVVKVWQRTA